MSTAAPDEPPTGGKVAKGALYLSVGNVLFIIAGTILQFGLPAILPTATFGAYVLVNNIASWVNNVIVTGTIGTVSKFAAAEPARGRDVQRAGLRMHARLGLVIAIVFVAGAPVIAWFLHDTTLIAPLVLAGLIAGLYAFYTVFIGYANATDQFKQAALSSIFAYVRVGLMLGMAIAGLGIIGVIGGWVVAAALIFLAAVVWIGLPSRGGTLTEPYPVAPLLRFFGGMAIYLVLFNLLLFVDTFLVKRLMAEHYIAAAPALEAALARALPWATRASGYHVDTTKLADVQVAYYGAVQNLARLPFQVALSATFVVFPLMSKATFDGDHERARTYVRTTMRYTLVGTALLAVAFAAIPGDMLGLVYAPDYVERGAAVLPPLVIGAIAFTLIATTGAIFNGAGRSRTAIVIAAITLVVAVVGNYVALSLAAGSDDVLFVAGCATGGAMVVGALVCGIALYRSYGAFIPMLSVVRVALATAIAVVAGYELPLHGKPMTIVKAALVVVVFVAVLVVTRELGPRDLQAIKAARKKPAPQGEST